MRAYTAAAVARFLGITEKRVKQLTEAGTITAIKPGLYILQTATQQYIKSLKEEAQDENVDFKTEKALFMKSKRKLADLELDLRAGDLHETEEIKIIMESMLLNFRARLRAIPAKLAPTLAEKTDKAEVFSLLKGGIDEALQELSDFDTAFSQQPEEVPKE